MEQGFWRRVSCVMFFLRRVRITRSLCSLIRFIHRKLPIITWGMLSIRRSVGGLRLKASTFVKTETMFIYLLFLLSTKSNYLKRRNHEHEFVTIIIVLVAFAY